MTVIVHDTSIQAQYSILSNNLPKSIIEMTNDSIHILPNENSGGIRSIYTMVHTEYDSIIVPLIINSFIDVPILNETTEFPSSLKTGERFKLYVQKPIGKDTSVIVKLNIPSCTDSAIVTKELRRQSTIHNDGDTVATVLITLFGTTPSDSVLKSSALKSTVESYSLRFSCTVTNKNGTVTTLFDKEVPVVSDIDPETIAVSDTDQETSTISDTKQQSTATSSKYEDKTTDFKVGQDVFVYDCQGKLLCITKYMGEKNLYIPYYDRVNNNGNIIILKQGELTKKIIH
jgi:hypothetical protein